MASNLVHLRNVAQYSIDALRLCIRNNLDCNKDGQPPCKHNEFHRKQGHAFATLLAKLQEADDVEHVLQGVEPILRTGRLWDNTWSKRKRFYDIIWDKMVALDIDDGWTKCDDCSSIVHDDDIRSVWGDRLVCEACCGDNYTWSEVMQEYLPADETVHVYNSRRSYRNGDPDDYGLSDYDLDDYIWDEGRGAWVYYEVADELGEEDDSDYEAEERRPQSPLESIGSYHSCKGYVGHIPSEYDREQPRLLLGVELEVEVISEEISRESAASLVRSTLNSDGMVYCGTENDGSLNHGFEIVTGYTGLDVHEQMLKKFCQPTITRGLKSHDTETCGLHVHVDKASITPIQALRLVDFVSEPGNRPLIEAIARRYNTGYCIVKSKQANREQLFDTWRAHRDGIDNIRTDREVYRTYQPRLASSVCESRYEAINMQNTRTIEFRLFRGSLKLVSIMACLEFSRALCLFVREHGDAEMDTSNFLLFIEQPRHRRETRYLRNRLKSLGFPVKASKKELETLLVTKLTKRKQPACVS